MSWQSVGRPCRNFNILGITRINDPKDGREKVVLSNFAAGATGSLILVDPRSREGESIPLPGDCGAWAVLNYRDERLIVGTCPDFGYLHCLDLKQRAWKSSLRDEHEGYIWNLALGSDGMVYGGTYPGCVLLRYDPQGHRLENLGRVSDNVENLYSRMVYSLPGCLLINCGYAEPHVTRWDLARGTARPFGNPGAQVKEASDDVVCTETRGALNFYNARTLQPLDSTNEIRLSAPRKSCYEGARLSVELGNGHLFAIRGQEYCVEGLGDTLSPIPTPRPPTGIQTLTSDSRGRIWGSSSFGQTVFCFDPATAQEWNSHVVCNSGGEVYGMAFVGSRLFMSAYSGGDHIVYDPAQPWDQIGNANPQALEPVRPALIRPSARSVVGPDGHFWTGWMAKYGVYGGGLSRIDGTNLQMRCWHDPVPEQAVIGLTADDRNLYFITGNDANGLPRRTVAPRFVVWSPAGRIVWQRSFDAGSALHAVAAVRNRVFLAVDSTVQVFNPDTMTFDRVVPLAEACRLLLPWGDSAAAFCGKRLWRIHPFGGDPKPMCDLPGGPRAAAFTPNGDLYFAVETELYRIQRV